MYDEKLQILNMIREGKITVDEAAKLLDAIDKSTVNNNDLPNNNNNNVIAKWLKVKVIGHDNNAKVNITLPISLLSIGVKLAEKFSPEFKSSGLTQSDLDEILVVVKSASVGKIIDIESENGEKIEIIIE